MPFLNDATTATTWNVWMSNATTSSTNTTIIWNTWNTTVNALGGLGGGQLGQGANAYYNYQAPPETAEARTARVERERLAEVERVAAQGRAEQLLRDHLTIEQAAQLTQADYFEVISESGKRYRIHRGVARNIRLLEGGRPVRGYCIHPSEDVPAPDAMLAQKLMLETCERDFLRIANEFAAAA